MSSPNERKRQAGDFAASPARAAAAAELSPPPAAKRTTDAASASLTTLCSSPARGDSDRLPDASSALTRERLSALPITSWSTSLGSSESSSVESNQKLSDRLPAALSAVPVPSSAQGATEPALSAAAAAPAAALTTHQPSTAAAIPDGAAGEPGGRRKSFSLPTPSVTPATEMFNLASTPFLMTTPGALGGWISTADLSAVVSSSYSQTMVEQALHAAATHLATSPGPEAAAAPSEPVLLYSGSMLPPTSQVLVGMAELQGQCAAMEDRAVLAYCNYPSRAAVDPSQTISAPAVLETPGSPVRSAFPTSSLCGDGLPLVDRDALADALRSPPGTVPATFVGVFDGHGGDTAARLAQSTLHTAVLKHPDLLTDPFSALADGYRATEEAILSQAAAGSTDLLSCGTTACTALIVSDRIYFANVGDSLALLIRRPNWTNSAPSLLSSASVIAAAGLAAAVAGQGDAEGDDSMGRRLSHQEEARRTAIMTVDYAHISSSRCPGSSASSTSASSSSTLSANHHPLHHYSSTPNLSSIGHHHHHRHQHHQDHAENDHMSSSTFCSQNSPHLASHSMGDVNTMSSDVGSYLSSSTSSTTTSAVAVASSSGASSASEGAAGAASSSSSSAASSTSSTSSTDADSSSSSSPSSHPPPRLTSLHLGIALSVTSTSSTTTAIEAAATSTAGGFEPLWQAILPESQDRRRSSPALPSMNSYYHMLVVSDLHRPSNPAERQRVTSAGGVLWNGRLGHPLWNPQLVNLAVTRSLGDPYFKQPAFVKEKNSGLVAAPRITSLPITDDLAFAMLATDGFWEACPWARAVSYVLRCAGMTCDRICNGLVKLAESSGKLRDNASVVLIQFKQSPSSGSYVRAV